MSILSHWHSLTRRLGQSGQGTLIAVMSVAALTGVMGYGMYQLINSWQSSSAWERQRHEFDLFAKDMLGLVKDPAICSSMIGPSIFPAAGMSNIQLHLRYRGQAGPLTPGFELAPDMHIESIELVDYTMGNTAPAKFLDAGGTVQDAIRHIGMLRIMVQGTNNGAMVWRRRLDLPMSFVVGAGVVQVCASSSQWAYLCDPSIVVPPPLKPSPHCYTEVSVMDLCEWQAGTYSPQLGGTDLKCLPHSECITGGIFSAAMGTVNPLTGTYSCQPGFTAQQAGPDHYQCLRCF